MKSQEEKDEWRREWVGMPEFEQTKSEEPYHKLTVRFASKEDLDSFAKLLGQNITNKTKSIWHPQIERGLNANKLYVYESEISDIHNQQGAVAEKTNSEGDGGDGDSVSRSS